MEKALMSQNTTALRSLHGHAGNCSLRDSAQGPPEAAVLCPATHATARWQRVLAQVQQARNKEVTERQGKVVVRAQPGD